jgi:hypothetical protein
MAVTVLGCILQERESISAYPALVREPGVRSHPRTFALAAPFAWTPSVGMCVHCL